MMCVIVDITLIASTISGIANGCSNVLTKEFIECYYPNCSN